MISRKASGVMSASDSDLELQLHSYRRGGTRDLFSISHEQFVADRSAKTRGTGNPSVMNKVFWKYQIGPEGSSGWNARETFNEEDPSAASGDPVWSFHRFGATYTRLPDGLVVCIGGEHEDYYDPDFCIYNGRSPLSPHIQQFTPENHKLNASFEPIPVILAAATSLIEFVH